MESVDKIILYTGDMRISQNDIQKFKALHSNSHVRILDKVYLDSTFFNEQYWSFPSRTEVVAALTNRIRNFLGKNSSNQILLRTSALIGYEYAFIAIARKLKRQIHVSDFLYRIFSYVPEVGSALTNDCQKARIHVITPRCKPCLEDSKKKNVLHVKLSAQWYKSSRNSEPKVGFYKLLSLRFKKKKLQYFK